MIYEFTKARSTAVAQLEPNFTNAWISVANQYGWSNLPVGHTCNNSVIGVTGERVCLDDMPAWLKLNGV